MTELEQAMKWAEDQKGKFKSHGIVLAEEIQRLRTELEMSDRRGNVLSEIVSNHCIAMQSAWIDSELVSPERGMKWIFNTLLGPGLLPNLDAARECGGAQAWFDRESAEDDARRAKEKEAAK